MRKLMAVALVLAVATTVGCTPGRDKQAARSRERDAVARAGQTPSPSASEPDLTERIRAAVIPVDGLAAVGGPAGTDKSDQEDVFSLARICNADLPLQWARDNHGLLRVWRNEKLWVSNLVSANREVDAAKVVEAVQAATGSCKEYEVSGSRYTVVAPVQLGTLAGVEASYAWSERLDKQGDKGAVCEVYLGQGKIVSWLTVVAAKMDTATTGCRQIATIAAAQLAKA